MPVLSEVMTLLVHHGLAVKSATDDMMPLFQVVDKVTPEVMPLAVKLMSTGSPLAQHSTAYYLHELLIGVDENRDGSTDPHATLEEVYRDLITNYMDTPFAMKLTILWNLNNVASAIGMGSTGVDRIRDWVEHNCAIDQGNCRDDNYWRGVAALHLAISTAQTIDLFEYEEFITWAGSSDEMSRIITLARDRNIFTVGELESIIKEQDTIASSLSSGVI